MWGTVCSTISQAPPILCVRPLPQVGVRTSESIIASFLCLFPLLSLNLDRGGQEMGELEKVDESERRRDKNKKRDFDAPQLDSIPFD